jgi:hypothetical protein
MTPAYALGYSTALFLALAVLLKWKCRRIANARRVRRSLRSFLVQEGCKQDDIAA